mgnify:CR=1 FL=1
MKNKKAIKWFENRIAVMPDSETKEMFCMAVSALEKQEQDGWIPCSERLPDKSEDYLVTNYIEKWGDKITETCEAFYVYSDSIYKTSYWCGSENHKLGKVSAWRPLPEPYTEEEE